MISSVNDIIRQRIHKFESIFNFRDLGGFRTTDGRTVAFGRVFRSGELHHATDSDLVKLRHDFKITSIIDLRSTRRIAQTGPGSLAGVPFRRYTISLELEPEHNEIESSTGFTNMGELYFFRVRQPEYGRKIIRALEIIADPLNAPVLFHCNAGKDRAGILAALLLDLIGVSEEDIIEDYTLSAIAMKDFIQRLNDDSDTARFQKKKPDYQKKAVPESMSFLLAALKSEYGSVWEYLKMHGADPSLVSRLKALLLV